LGDNHGLFQGAHGSAPDIAGEDLASPVATLLSSCLMLNWLADRHGDHTLSEAATRIENAINSVLAAGVVIPTDLGGTARCSEFTNEVCRSLG